MNATGQLTSVGITCALCHSSVDNSFAPGIGHRLDGWANTSRMSAPSSRSRRRSTMRRRRSSVRGGPEVRPRHHAFNGTSIIPLNTPSLPIAIPPIYGLKGVGFETYTADGPIWYWNSYVGVSQMGGHGSFSDPRIGVSITQTPDLVTPKLAALLDYQLSLKTPDAPKGSYDESAAQRGKKLFRDEAQCSTCHRNPDFTDVLRGPDNRVPFLHDPAEVGQDPGYAQRTATGMYLVRRHCGD